MIRFVKIALVIMIGSSTLLAGAWWSTQRQPSFYRLALSTPAIQLEEQGDQFEETIIQLANDMRHEGHWQAILTEDQINGWIASDLPEKFPDALPSNITDPRVSISDAFVELAFRFDSKKLSGIVHIKGEVFCTSQPNQLALRIVDVRSGWISIPFHMWADRIQQSLARRGVALSWVELDGNAVALLDLPDHLTHREDQADTRQKISVESIQLFEGEMQLIGTTARVPNDPSDVADQIEFNDHR